MTLFLDALGLEHVALVGNHTGGGIAVQMAVNQPDRVRALIVIGSPLFGEEEGRDWLENYIPTFEIEPKGEHLTWLWDRYRNIWGDDTPPWLFDLATTEFLRTGTRYHWGYRAAFPLPLGTSLAFGALSHPLPHQRRRHVAEQERAVRRAHPRR